MNTWGLFTRHPQSVGETYVQHMLHALGFGVRMILAGIACIIHAFLPFLFVSTASRAINELYDRMVLKRRARAGAANAPTSAPIRGH